MAVLARMLDAILKRMRDRAQQLRRVADMAHDAGMTAMLLKIARQIETDAAHLGASPKRGIW